MPTVVCVYKTDIPVICTHHILFHMMTTSTRLHRKNKQWILKLHIALCEYAIRKIRCHFVAHPMWFYGMPDCMLPIHFP